MLGLGDKNNGLLPFIDFYIILRYFINLIKANASHQCNNSDSHQNQNGGGVPTFSRVAHPLELVRLVIVLLKYHFYLFLIFLI